MTRPRLLATAALLLTAAALTVAGCSAGTGTTNNAGAAGSAPASGTPAGSPTAAASQGPSPTGGYRDQIMAWARRFAACARTHGQPNFPDPIYPTDWGPNGPNDGNTLFPERNAGSSLFHIQNPADKVSFVRALDACTDVARQEPPAPDSLRPPTARELAIMREFSQCMRRHGFSSFPDPRADGTFPIQGGPYASLNQDAQGQTAPKALDNAYLACATGQARFMPLRASS